MEKGPAIEHLRTTCVQADESDGGLEAQWRSAREKLKSRLVNAGSPRIADLPSAAEPHVAQLRARYPDDFDGMDVKLVEIDPLLAMQFTIIPARCAKHFSFDGAPNEDQLLHACLPAEPPIEEIEIVDAPGSVMIRAKSTVNLQVFDEGEFEKTIAGRSHRFAGLQYGLSSHFVHVVRFRGRCFLHNGYHRAYGLRKRGVEMMPCIFRDVGTPEAVGVKRDAQGNLLTFGMDLLESANPPTIAHFTMGRAHDVRVRVRSRLLQVSWAVYTLTEDDLSA